MHKENEGERWLSPYILKGQQFQGNTIPNRITTANLPALYNY